MMQILSKIGIEIVGREYPYRNNNKRGKRAKELNPKGFYEVPGIVVRGIDDESFIDEHFSGKAVKILFPGVGRVPMGKVDKIIYCVRDPKIIMHSQRLLTGNTIVNSKSGEVFANEVKKLSFRPYFNRTGRFCFWLDGNDVFWDKSFIVDYDDLMTKPELVLKQICRFLGKVYSDDILDCIDPSLYRSQAVEIEENNELAENIYLATKSKDVSGVMESLRYYFEDQRVKNVRWVDDEFGTWTTITIKSYHSYLNDNRFVRSRLIASLPKRKKFYPISCKHYNRDGSEYTIKRYGIPDLVRKKVLCKGHEKTLEECCRCWMRNLNG